MKILALFDVGAAAVQSGFLIVPQNETDRTFGLHVRAGQNAGQFHHQGRARSIVVGGLAPADAVEVRAEDVHLFRMRDSGLRAIDLFPGARHRRLGIELAQLRIRLRVRIIVHSGANAQAPWPSSPDSSGRGRRRRARPSRSIRHGVARVRRGRLVVVLEALDICAAVTFELGFDPVEGPAIAIGPLLSIAELRQPLDRGLIAFQVEPIHENFCRVGNRFRRALRRGRSYAPGRYLRNMGDRDGASRGNHQFPLHLSSSLRPVRASRPL